MLSSNDFYAKWALSMFSTTVLGAGKGEVERQNCSLLKLLGIAQAENVCYRDELLCFLTAYLSTPHSVTGKCPLELRCWPASVDKAASSFA